MKSSLRYGCVLLAALSLSACSGLREDLGLGRNTPDEFAVMDHAPLSMPPDFTLRPPTPGAPRPQETAPAQDAAAALFGPKESAPVTALSSGEKDLLDATHATMVNPRIRTIIDHEAAEKVVGDEHLVHELLSWDGDKKPATVVDAPAEAQRLKDAKDKGQKPNATPTPIIEKEKAGWLGL